MTSLKNRAAKKIRLQLDDGIPLVIKYGWSGQTYSLEDGRLAPSEGAMQQQRPYRTSAELTYDSLTPPFDTPEFNLARLCHPAADDWEIFLERFGNEKEANRECHPVDLSNEGSRVADQSSTLLLVSLLCTL